MTRAIRANAEGTGLLMSHVRAGARLPPYLGRSRSIAPSPTKSRPRPESDPLGSHPNYAPSYGVSKGRRRGGGPPPWRGSTKLPTIIGRLGANYGEGCSGVVRRGVPGNDVRPPHGSCPPRDKSYVALVYKWRRGPSGRAAC